MSDRYLIRKTVLPDEERRIRERTGSAVPRALQGWLPAGSERRKQPAIDRVRRLVHGGFVTDSHTGEVVFMWAPALEAVEKQNPESERALYVQFVADHVVVRTGTTPRRYAVARDDRALTPYGPAARTKAAALQAGWEKYRREHAA